MAWRATTHAVIVLPVAFVLACQPFYRDAENRGRLIQSPTYVPGLLHDAEQAEKAHDPARAAALYAEAIEIDPAGTEPSTYLAAARAFDQAGRPIVARALVLYDLEQAPGAGELRDFVAGSYARAGLVSRALDQLDSPSLAQAVEVDGLAARLRELEQASSLTDRDPARALALYRVWLASYGEPDHPLLAAARRHILRAAWSAAVPARAHGSVSMPAPAPASASTSAPASALALGSASAPASVRTFASAPASVPASAPSVPASLRRLAGLADRADAALAAGRIHRALLLYSEAYRLLPDSIFEAHFAGFARAAAAAGAPADADPVAYQYALDGDDALRRNDLGEAIHQYRLAVAEAPWWAGARTNLAVLLDVGGDRDAANAERAWAARLPAGSSPGTLAVTSSVPLADEGAGSRWYEDSLADAVAGGGALLAVAGGVLYWIGRSSVSQANATSDLDVYDAARARAAIEQPLGLSLLGAGAAALATGVVLYHHDRNARGGDDVLSLAPAARGGLVTFEGGF